MTSFQDLFCCLIFFFSCASVHFTVFNLWCINCDVYSIPQNITDHEIWEKAEYVRILTTQPGSFISGLDWNMLNNIVLFTGYYYRLLGNWTFSEILRSVNFFGWLYVYVNSRALVRQYFTYISTDLSQGCHGARYILNHLYIMMISGRPTSTFHFILPLVLPFNNQFDFK